MSTNGMRNSDGSKNARMRHIVEYVPVRAIGYLLRGLPGRLRRSLGGLLGRLVFSVDARHRNVTLNNLDIAFGDVMKAEDKLLLARRTFEHFGAMVFDLISLESASRDELAKVIEFEGLDRYERAKRKGKGVILVGAHFGNWELNAIAHGLQFGRFFPVARALDNPYFNGWLERIRGITGNEVVYKQQALTRTMRLLKENETVGLVVDQNVSVGDCVFVDFFGRKAASTPVASMLGLKTGATLVPVFAHPLPDGRYLCIYEEPIDPQAFVGEERQKALHDMTQRCATALESYVRRYPYYWLWMHRRWKTRPPEERTEERNVGSPATDGRSLSMADGSKGPTP